MSPDEEAGERRPIVSLDGTIRGTEDLTVLATVRDASQQTPSEILIAREEGTVGVTEELRRFFEGDEETLNILLASFVNGWDVERIGREFGKPVPEVLEIRKRGREKLNAFHHRSELRESAAKWADLVILGLEGALAADETERIVKGLPVFLTADPEAMNSREFALFVWKRAHDRLRAKQALFSSAPAVNQKDADEMIGLLIGRFLAFVRDEGLDPRRTAVALDPLPFESESFQAGLRKSEAYIGKFILTRDSLRSLGPAAGELFGRRPYQTVGDFSRLKPRDLGAGMVTDAVVVVGQNRPGDYLERNDFLWWIGADMEPLQNEPFFEEVLWTFEMLMAALLPLYAERLKQEPREIKNRLVHALLVPGVRRENILSIDNRVLTVRGAVFQQVMTTWLAAERFAQSA